MTYPVHTPPSKPDSGKTRKDCKDRFSPARSSHLPRMRSALWTILVLAVLSVASTSNVRAADENQPYILGRGDVLRVTVFGEEDLSGTFTIGDGGAISMPLIGKIPAAGKTLDQLDAALTAQFRNGYLTDPHVSTQITTYRPFYIMGEINVPGSYPYVSGMTVLTAVSLGGGFTYRADKTDIEIIRANDPAQKPVRATAKTPVHPGDIIRITERLF